MEAKVLKNLMEANDDFAEQIRVYLRERRIPMLNLIGGPGCGKTALLEKTIAAMAPGKTMAVIEGDIATPRDAERIAAAGAAAIQINTDGSCHLDAHLVLRSLEELSLDGVDLVVVENVGNLVCPAEFDIGENKRVALLSVTEGDDKPMKYPLVFREADVVLLTKIDLLPYVPFDKERFAAEVRHLNGTAPIIEVSAHDGTGLAVWVEWLDSIAAEVVT